MLDTVLTLIYGATVLLYGTFLSAAFAGIKINRKNFFYLIALDAVCGALHVVFAYIGSFNDVWTLYPIVTHIPLILFICLFFRKKFATALASVCTAYLCCQPSKWFGILALYIWNSDPVNHIVRTVSLMIIFPVIFKFIAPIYAVIFNQEKRSVYLFNIAPLVYYFYDYLTAIYTDMIENNHILATEFMPFFLLVVYILFTSIYYKEHQQKMWAERKQQIVNITVEEQRKEVAALRSSEKELRLIRHDMRLLLNNISVCIDNDDKDTARKLISTYVDNINATAVKKYCNNTTLNYIISSFAKKCKEQQIEFTPQIAVEKISCDEIMLSTIISNALDNAINAQKKLPANKRKINFMLKSQDGKLLLSVKNPFADMPVFSGGLPVSKEKGHGYGTQSIMYLIELMGGNCQFTTDGTSFIVRIVI